MRPPRVLFVACDSGGHFTSMVAFVRSLGRAGFEMFVLGNEPGRAAVEAAGAALVPPARPDEYGVGAVMARALRGRAPAAARLPTPLKRRGVEAFVGKRERELAFRRELPGMVARMAEEVARAAAAHDVDVVVADVVSFGAAYGAKAAGRPYASLATDPAFALDAGGRPFLLPHLRLRRVPAGAWRGVVDAVLPLKGVRRSFGLPPQSFTAELYASCVSEGLHLVVAPEGWAGVPTAPGHRFVGPLAYAPGDGDAGVASAVGPDTVLVTGSTTGHPKGVLALRRAIAALAETSLQVVVAAGPMPDAPRVPPNVRILPGHAPHDVLIPRAGVVVTHGGWGVVGRALRGGTPLVVTPAFGPQDFVGDRVEKLSLGVQVPLDAISPSALERACARAMTDARIRASSKAMAERLAGVDTAALCAEAIERFARGTRRALATPP